MRESHQAEDHYGYLGEAQLRWFADKLAPYGQEGWLRIAALHHNIRRGPVADDENLRDADDLQRLLGPSVNLILHGHTHDGKLDWLTPKVPILSTGSAAVMQQARPEEIPNQYQIIELWGDRFKRWARAFEPRRKMWIGDTRASATGDDWRDEQPVAFEDVDGTFPAPDVIPPAILRPDFESFGKIEGEYIKAAMRDDFQARVERVCRLRESGVVEVTAQQAGAPPLSYLRVTVKQDGFVQEYPVGVSEHGIDEHVVERFLLVHQRYQETDPGVRSWLVHGGDAAPPDLKQRVEGQRIRLVSFVEYQGLLDFRTYVREQTRRLERNPLYVPELYVPQRLRYQIGQEEQSSEDALATRSRAGWLNPMAGLS
jgi:hypothetical protein